MSRSFNIPNILRLSLMSLISAQFFFTNSTPAFAAETAKILPKGIFRARLATVQTGEIEQQINADGETEPFGDRLNRSFTVDDLIQKDPRVLQLVNTLNGISPGLGAQLMNANLYNDMSIQVTTFVPALEYGLTEKLSLGLRVPVVRRIVRNHFSAESVNNAQYLNAQVGGLSDELRAGLNLFGAQAFDTNMFKNQIFLSKGYAPEGFDRTEIGDIEFGGKYNFYASDEFYATTQLGLRAPTGSTASLKNIYDKGSGGGAWGLGTSFFQEYLPSKHIGFAAMQKMTYFLPDTQDRAVPRNEDEALPSLLPQDGQVQSVTRTQGLKFEGELSSTLYFMDSDISIWSAYQFMTKSEDTYTGSGDLHYDGLAAGSEQFSHHAEIGAGYSTIGAFRRKEFAVPAQIQLLYNTTLDGKNVAMVDYMRLDLIVYF